MTTLREAAQQALEALEAFLSDELRPYEAAKTSTALRAALARQAEPVEPYCYVYEYDGAFGLHREFYPKVYNGHKPDRTVPVYTAPPQQAEPQDAELSAALGWPGGISEPVLDRKVLLQKVAALMQDKLWEDHRVRHLWDHTLAQQAEPVLQGPVRIKPGSYTLGATWVGGGGGSGGVGAPPQQPKPVEPVAWVHTDAHNPKVRFLEWTQQAKGYRGDWIKTPLCNCAQPRQSDPQIEDRLARHGIPKP